MGICYTCFEVVIGIISNQEASMIEHTKGVTTPLGDVTCITGTGINFLRMAYLLMGLRIEASGMRLTMKAPSCQSIVKREYGLRGNLAKVTTQFEAILNQAKAQQVHVMRDQETGAVTQL
jgi:hypothetical protein